MLWILFDLHTCNKDTACSLAVGELYRSKIHPSPSGMQLFQSAELPF
uniref:Uncharacterized protein n=1 Tax=Scleropages formosus TaxID=113540 RepID=A0A8C9TRH9_SCLFO